MISPFFALSKSYSFKSAICRRSSLNALQKYVNLATLEESGPKVNGVVFAVFLPFLLYFFLASTSFNLVKRGNL
jgi:hypothetical protein